MYFTFTARYCIVDTLFINLKNIGRLFNFMKKRESFNNQWGFILACIGSAVGMGNIWMFPTRVSMYGGGAIIRVLLPNSTFASTETSGKTGENSGTAADSNSL